MTISQLDLSQCGVPRSILQTSIPKFLKMISHKVTWKFNRVVPNLNGDSLVVFMGRHRHHVGAGRKAKMSNKLLWPLSVVIDIRP